MKWIVRVHAELIIGGKKMTRYASHFLYLSPADYLNQHVVELKDGYAYRIFPLREEVESTQWLGGIILLSTSTSAIGNVTVDAKGYIQSELPVYAYQVINDNTLERLQ